MKVIVRCAKNRVIKTEMEREIERLFQENKDLRVQVGHLRDELANAQASAEIQRGFREEMAEEIEALEKELVKSENESSQGMNAMVKFWEEAVTEKNKAEERAEEYRIALMESDCRVDELEKQLAWMREEVARLTNERDTAVNENTVITFDFNELREKWEVERNLRTKAERQVEELRTEVDACHHNIDGYIEGNRRMRAEYEKKMEAEQDQTKYWHKKHDEVLQKMEGYKTQLIVANKENLARAKTMEQLQEEYNELEANFDELERVHKLWGEEIDRLRRVVTELQTNRFTTDEFISMIMKNFMPSTDK
jgi:DNA repair exonuclease SbcCD ATPase subunit